MTAENGNLRGCPTFVQGLSLVAGQQPANAMDPMALQAHMTASPMNSRKPFTYKS